MSTVQDLLEKIENLTKEVNAIKISNFSKSKMFNSTGTFQNPINFTSTPNVNGVPLLTETD